MCALLLNKKKVRRRFKKRGGGRLARVRGVMVCAGSPLCSFSPHPYYPPPPAPLPQSTPLLVVGSGGSNDAQGKVLIPISVSAAAAPPPLAAHNVPVLCPSGRAHTWSEIPPRPTLAPCLRIPGETHAARAAHI